MTADPKRVARRVLEEVFGAGHVDVADELLAPNFVGRDPALPSPTTGVAAFKVLVSGYRTAFPDIRITVHDQVAEGDRAVTRWTAVGTHKGELWGLPPTGKQATVSGITIDRVENGRVAESWSNWDTLGLMQQLGLVPAMTTP